jgi:hypothetical protein
LWPAHSLAAHSHGHLLNGVEIDRDRCAFLQDVELKDRLPIKKFFVRVIPVQVASFADKMVARKRPKILWRTNLSSCLETEETGQKGQAENRSVT